MTTCDGHGTGLSPPEGVVVSVLEGEVFLAFQTSQGWISINLGGRKAAHSIWKMLETALFEIPGDTTAQTDPADDAETVQ